MHGFVDETEVTNQITFNWTMGSYSGTGSVINLTDKDEGSYLLSVYPVKSGELGNNFETEVVVSHATTTFSLDYEIPANNIGICKIIKGSDYPTLTSVGFFITYQGWRFI